MWSLWKIVNLSWSLNQNFQGEFCHCFSVIADATAAAAAAAKGRQNGGGGEQKSYRVTISAPIIFHCRSTTLYKTRRRNFSNEWVWKNTILRSGDAILWTCDKYLILQANREKFATWSHPPHRLRRHPLLPQCSRQRCLRTDTHVLHSRTIVCQKECTFWKK